MKPYHLIVSGYSSFDHMLKLLSPAVVGKTSLIANSSCSKTFWGGCSVNIAVALSRLGLKVLTVLRVGDDFESSGFKTFLQEEGISLDAITYIPDETNPRSFLLQDPEGEHITTFYPGAMDEIYFSPYPDAWFENIEAALMTVASYKDNLEFLQKVRKYQIPLFFGMKGDFSAFPPDMLEEIFRESAILFMNRTESEQLVELMELNSIEDVFSIGKAEVLVITLGSDGSRYIARDGSSETVPAVKIEHVVDTTGGGDGFISGFLYGYFTGLSYKECCQYGSLVSSFVLEAEGCTTNLPDLGQLLKRKQERG
jgi:sugar/nucleoside kinase (ribokinase family)